MKRCPGLFPAAARSAAPGFTLIELLVVVMIVTLLISVLLPGLRGAREAGRSAACLSRLHNLHVAVRVYADDYRTFPVENATEVIEPLELGRASWRCPADERARRDRSPVYSSYSYIALIYMDPPDSGLVLAELKPWVAYRKYENNPLLPLFWNAETCHEGERNVVYWNGSARRKDW